MLRRVAKPAFRVQIETKKIHHLRDPRQRFTRPGNQTVGTVVICYSKELRICHEESGAHHQQRTDNSSARNSTSIRVRPGDKLLFETDGVSVRVRPVRTKSPFEKYRGIGSPGIASGKKAVVEWVRKLRGR